MKIKLTLTSKSRSARISPQFASLGEVAEWSNVAVLKTVVARATVGSNPTLTVVYVESCESGLSGLPAKQL